ncbi:origin recognition complex subunit 4 C-terminus-domain-containing protein [Coniella lustricola]|uniref:Origin recognition complex subunit 4 C-terminus-domain-containing protein n=1 Tax=Coniella lustricola TaxID=2025994 RepID=A0A2T2ZXZ5_9PEZI|nr:origin recognition complex subunit 4 C-terminus-domain-containing protein [Coniella lustricola]
MAPTPGSTGRKRGRPRKDEADRMTPIKKARMGTVPTDQQSSPTRSTNSKNSSSRATGRRNKALVDAGSIPNTDEEGQATYKPAAVSSRDDIDDIYDFPGSDRDSSPVKSTSARIPRDSHLTRATPLGRKNSGSITKKPLPKIDTEQANASPTHSKRRSRKPVQSEIYSETERGESEGSSDSEDVLASAKGTPAARKVPLAVADGPVPLLKGILTPSKRLSKRNTKNVAFDELAVDNTVDEIYFSDLPKKPVQSKSSAEIRPAGKENRPIYKSDESNEAALQEEDDEDEDVCAICSKPDSNPPNEILFCDGCDMAVHQKCYGVARIPKGDWLCKTCSQDLLVPVAMPESGKTIVANEAVPDIENFGQHLQSLKRVLLDRCVGRRRIKLCHQDEAYDKTFQLVEQTVLAGEGNSMLVIGARGCGKTTMVDSVLSDLSLEHGNEFHVVRLNGFIHTDDKLALRDIWRQLGKEMEVEEEIIGKTNNYADTLASLLALLSHPSEIAGAQDGLTSKSIVFVIDEFDLFATHARQTLLYNLFDIAQARKAPIAVLGLTNRIDVVESLEKRVKSRFSHRYVYMSLAKTLAAYWSVCKQGLTVDEQDADQEGLDISLAGHTEFQDYWTKKIDTLYAHQLFKDHIEYHYYSTKSVPAFLASCIMPLASLSPANLSLHFLTPAIANDPPDSKLHLLGSLSDLDLSLLIAAARLDIVAHTDTVNFAMAYDEYTTLIGRQRVQSATAGMLALGGAVRVWGRGVAEMAWERLVSLGLLLPTGMGSRHGGIESRMWKVDAALEEIPVAVKLNAILQRWCKEI